MPPNSIARLLKSTGLAGTIAGILTESTLRPSSRTELRVCLELEKRGWKILAHDVEIAHVQIDILARNPQGVLTIVEVKSQSHMAHISRGQYLRLRRVGAYLSGYEPVQMELALMSLRELTLLPVDGLTV